MKLWDKIKHKIDVWLHDEWEVTIYFQAQSFEKEGGIVTTAQPKTYVCKKLVKVSETHFKLLTTDGKLVEIKTVSPVGYDVVKTK